MVFCVAYQLTSTLNHDLIYKINDPLLVDALLLIRGTSPTRCWMVEIAEAEAEMGKGSASHALFVLFRLCFLHLFSNLIYILMIMGPCWLFNMGCMLNDCTGNMYLGPCNSQNSQKECHDLLI